MFLMAHQLLGRPIQPTYLLISHVKSLFWHSPPLLPPRFFLNPSSSKHFFPQTPSLSSYRPLLCTATSQPAAALIKDQQQKQLQLPFENGDYEDDTENEEEDENSNDEENDGSDDIQENEEVVSSLEQKQSTNASKIPSRRIPQLTVKEKKQLKSYAQGLGKKLKCHQGLGITLFAVYGVALVISYGREKCMLIAAFWRRESSPLKTHEGVLTAQEMWRLETSVEYDRGGI